MSRGDVRHLSRLFREVNHDGPDEVGGIGLQCVPLRGEIGGNGSLNVTVETLREVFDESPVS